MSATCKYSTGSHLLSKIWTLHTLVLIMNLHSSPMYPSTFLETKLIGCLFHLKQSIHRKMKEVKFPDKEVDYAMRRGVINLLTVIPIIQLKMGIEFVARMIKTHLAELHGDDYPEYIDAEKWWNDFWYTYFR